MRNRDDLALAVLFTAQFARRTPVPRKNDVVTPDLTRTADGQTWNIFNATPEIVEIDGKRALRLRATGDPSQRHPGWPW